MWCVSIGVICLQWVGNAVGVDEVDKEMEREQMGRTFWNHSIFEIRKKNRLWQALRTQEPSAPDLVRGPGRKDLGKVREGQGTCWCWRKWYTRAQWKYKPNCTLVAWQYMGSVIEESFPPPGPHMTKRCSERLNAMPVARESHRGKRHLEGMWK